MFKMRPPGKSGLAAGLLGLVFAAATLLWLRLDRAPPNWDDAWYLTNSLTVYDALTQGGFPGYLAKLNSVLGFKAPLIVALPAPFYLLLGRHWHAAFLVNIVSMWVLFAALYRVARRWWSRASGGFRHRDHGHDAAALRFGTVVHGGVCPGRVGGRRDLRARRVGRG